MPPAPPRINHYEILGVEPTATSEEIQKAYKKLCPDKNPEDIEGATEKLKQLVSSYGILNDPRKRKQR